tara:strand:+ start:19407 stop:19817 length:411 start_codon:yes stop_codon:yes gene_type:complete
MLSKEWGIGVLRIWFGITVLYIGYIDWSQKPDIFFELLQNIFSSPLYEIFQSLTIPLLLLAGITFTVGIAVRPSSTILGIILSIKHSHIFEINQVIENWDKFTLIVVLFSFWFIGSGSLNVGNNFLKGNRKKKSNY